MEKQSLIQIQSPRFVPAELHQEVEIKNTDVNRMFNFISDDMKYIKSSIVDCADNFKTLMDRTVLELSDIKKILDTEKEREEDMSILCNRETDFSNIILPNKNNSGTDLDFINGTLTLPKIESKQIKCEVVSITGNGYDGNKYVYNNNQFIENTINANKYSNITDKSMFTYFEYSRITANNSEKNVFPLVNFDSNLARCSVIVSAMTEFNMIKIHSDIKDVVLESISISDDGQIYKEQEIHDIQIINKENRFDDDSYIFGSGIIAFNDCKYVRLSFRASSFTDDTIAFTSKDMNGNSSVEILETAKRSVVRINAIEVFRNEYTEEESLTMDNITNENLESIAIFANEYCSDEINIRDSVKYILTVNGIEYDVVPINSNTNGKKIVRTTNQTIPAEHVDYTSETIKNASLAINMSTTKQNQTPYVSDIKILVGKAEE